MRGFVVAAAASALVLGAACGDSDAGLSSDAGTSHVVATDASGTADAAAPDVTGDVPTDVDVMVPSCDNCPSPAVCIDGFCVAAEPDGCEPAATGLCYGDQIMTCDATGTAFVPADCPPAYICFGGACVPDLCDPDKWYCEGLAGKKQCNGDGTAFLPMEGCPEGQWCNGGKCGSSCVSDPKFGSLVGCSFWTVDLPIWPDPTINPPPEDRPHALVVSNPGELDAELSFEAPNGITVDLPDPIVPGGQSRVILMPIASVQFTGVYNLGIRMDSTRPVLVHQFNPWEAVWSNDASLLLPENILGKHYVVVSWPTDPRGLIQIVPGIPPMPNVNGTFTVVATQDDTEVTIQVKGRVAAGDRVDAMPPGGVQTITINAGEVLNIEAEPLTIFEQADLTGSTVSATKPVAVFAGHESAGIEGCCLDHLEEQMLPRTILSTDYFAVKSKSRGGDFDIWRIVAAEDNVTVTTTPAQQGANGVTLSRRGDWLEVQTSASFEVHGTGKLMVAQYLIGQEATSSATGDPTLILSVPKQRFRDFYAFAVPQGYSENYVTVIKPLGVAVATAAGAIPQSEFTTFGTGTYEYAHVALSQGVYRFAGDAPFGLVAYGFNGAVSYGYPGGMSAGDE